MKVLEEKDNLLLNRKEVKIVVEAAKNPSLQEACKTISEKFKVQEDLVAVKEVKGKFGRNTFLISANIYDKKENKDILEKKKEKKASPGGK